MKLSIVIAHFNQLNELEATLRSILNQSWQDWEVIVQDAQSEGFSAFMQTQTDTRLKLFSEKDGGIYDAYNRGIVKAKGQYILFFGAGDLLSSTTVFSEILTVAANEPEIVFANAAYVNKRSAKIPDLHHGHYGSSLRWRNGLHHQATLYHRSCFAKKSFDLRFKILADYELNLWLWKNGAKAEKWRDEFAKVDASGVSKVFDASLYAEERAIKKIHLSPFWFAPAALFSRLKYLVKRA